MRFKRYLIEQKNFKKMGLKFYQKWEDFVKNNKKVIDKKVKEIKKETSIISNEKLRNKKYKEEIRDFKNELTNLWSSIKK